MLSFLHVEGLYPAPTVRKSYVLAVLTDWDWTNTNFIVAEDRYSLFLSAYVPNAKITPFISW